MLLKSRVAGDHKHPPLPSTERKTVKIDDTLADDDAEKVLRNPN